MLKEELTFTDFNDNKRIETVYLNLSEREVEKLQAKGWMEKMERVGASGDSGLIYDAFEELVGMAYGIKSEDGSSFSKSKEITEQFMQTAAYDALMEKILASDEAAMAFLQGIMPTKYKQAFTAENIEEAKKEAAKLAKKTTKKAK